MPSSEPPVEAEETLDSAGMFAMPIALGANATVNRNGMVGLDAFLRYFYER